ncbi:MAG TPA: hypothetical protein VFZ77_00075 [Acidimicrobiales bacterium]
MTDDRIARYLVERAGSIELPAGDPARVAHRVARRRHLRRGIASALAATVVAGGSVALAQRAGDAPDRLAIDWGVVAPSPLDWSVAEPSSGIADPAAVSATALTDGGVYSLSTAPAGGSPGAREPGRPATLYRSGDGADWTPVDLPGDFWAEALAGSGGRLYAVGTAPAGGGTELRVEASADGGATWSSATVPSDLADLQRRYPGEVVTGRPTIAAHGGTVVVALPVFGSPDIEGRLPGGSLPAWADSWELTEDGVVVFASAECETVRGERPGEVRCGDSAAADRPMELYTWSELGVDAELRDLALAGRSDVAVSQDGGEFTPVDLGAAAPPGSASAVVATDDGFRLLLTTFAGEGRTAVLASADGAAWRPVAELPGALGTAGTVGGRAAAAVTAGPGGVTSIHLEQADGTWRPVDPRGAVEARERAVVGAVAFGPLGWAATVYERPADGEAEGGPPEVEVVHSTDGTTLSVVPLDDVVEGPGDATIGVLVTADAVIVRLTDAVDGDPATVAAQQVVVGTPRG